jgi:hypothetical protein
MLHRLFQVAVLITLVGAAVLLFAQALNALDGIDKPGRY